MKLPFRHLLLCLCSGLLAALAFSSHYTGWLIWFAFVPYFFVLFSLPQRKWLYLKSSFFFGMAFYTGVVHWLPELHPLTWLAGVSDFQSLVIVYGGVLFISVIVSAWIWLYGLVLAWLKPQGLQRIYIPALLWMVQEWIQGLGDVSLPWARLAVSQYRNLPLLQIAHLTGSIFLSGLIIACNAALVLVLLDFAAERRPLWRQPSLRGLGVVLVLLAAVYGYGLFRLQQASPTLAPFTAAVVQGNISQSEKWSNRDQYWDSVQKIKTIYMDLTNQIAAQAKPALIVWPESAVPVLLKKQDWLQEEFRQLTARTGAYLFTGIFDMNPQTEQIYNAAVLMTPAGTMEGWYYKRQLVPFGEFLPYRDFLAALPLLGPLMGKINPLQTDTAKGLTAGNVATPLGHFGALICFESVYPHVARESVQAGAELLLVITNDGWYKDAIAIYQHLAHSVLRAIENDRFIVRAANTGISSLIDNRGHLLQETLPLERTALSGEVQPVRSLTLYTRWGEWVVYLAIFCLVVFAVWNRRRATKPCGPQ